MLKLTPQPTEPLWIDLLPGVRIQVRPPSTLAIMVARDAAGAAIRKAAEADDERSAEQISAEAGVAMAGAYARRTITAWTGIGDEAGEPAAVTPENIDAAMQCWPFYSAFDDKVLGVALSGGGAA